MSAVYILSDKTTAKKDHGRLVLESENGDRRSLPINDIDCLVLGRRAHITMPLIFALIERGAVISYINGRGEILASMGGETMTLRRLFCQKARFEEDETRLAFAREIVREKIRRQKKLVRIYVERKKDALLIECAEELGRFQKRAGDLCDIDELRGCEGMASRVYFNSFTRILNQNFRTWDGRSRRPAHDPVNALLNLAYAFLEREVRIAIIGARLDPRLGFLHANNGRKDSLVYDLMEPFRPAVADRLVLRMLNCGAISTEDFYHTEEDGCRLSENAFREWCAAHEDYMMTPVKKAYKGKTPREAIRKEVRNFADKVFARCETEEI